MLHLPSSSPEPNTATEMLLGAALRFHEPEGGGRRRRPKTREGEECEEGRRTRGRFHRRRRRKKEDAVFARVPGTVSTLLAPCNSWSDEKEGGVWGSFLTVSDGVDIAGMLEGASGSEGSVYT